MNERGAALGSIVPTEKRKTAENAQPAIHPPTRITKNIGMKNTEGVPPMN